jgi:hypothetical protein
VEERIAGTIPAAAARTGLEVAWSAVFATPNEAEKNWVRRYENSVQKNAEKKHMTYVSEGLQRLMQC